MTASTQALHFHTTAPAAAKWTYHAFLGDSVYKNDWSACQIPSKYRKHFFTADVCTVRRFVHAHWLKRCNTTMEWEVANNITRQRKEARFAEPPSNTVTAQARKRSHHLLHYELSRSLYATYHTDKWHTLTGRTRAPRHLPARPRRPTRPPADVQHNAPQERQATTYTLRHTTQPPRRLLDYSTPARRTQLTALPPAAPDPG